MSFISIITVKAEACTIELYSEYEYFTDKEEKFTSIILFDTALMLGFYARNPRSRRATCSKQFASTERKLALQRKPYDYSRSIIRHDLFQDLGPLPLPGRNDLLYRLVLCSLAYLVVLFASLYTGSKLSQIR